MNKHFLNIAHSKWAEVVEVTLTTTAKTVEVLKHLFSLHGIPEQVISDNGAQFTSTHFVECIRANGIQHTRSAAYYPSSMVKKNDVSESSKKPRKLQEMNC